jgi:hypothetical protein
VGAAVGSDVSVGANVGLSVSWMISSVPVLVTTDVAKSSARFRLGILQLDIRINKTPNMMTESKLALHFEFILFSSKNITYKFKDFRF